MSSTLTQYFYQAQLVNPNDMNSFYSDTANKLTAYFPVTPCICSGVNYTQTGTSNTISFTKGAVRFLDQPNSISGTTAQTTFAPIDPATVTITCPSASVVQYYIVTLLSQNQISKTSLYNNATILTTAMTLAQIAAASNPAGLIPLYTITNNSGIYTIGVDSNCAFNYGQILDGSDLGKYLPLTGGIITGGLTVNGPVFLEGTSNAITQVTSDSSSKIATTAFTKNAIYNYSDKNFYIGYNNNYAVANTTANNQQITVMAFRDVTNTWVANVSGSFNTGPIVSGQLKINLTDSFGMEPIRFSNFNNGHMGTVAPSQIQCGFNAGDVNSELVIGQGNLVNQITLPPNAAVFFCGNFRFNGFNF